MITKFVFQNNNNEWHVFRKDESGQYPECLCGYSYDSTETLETSDIIEGEMKAQIHACTLAPNMCANCVRELFGVLELAE